MYVTKRSAKGFRIYRLPKKIPHFDIDILPIRQSWLLNTYFIPRHLLPTSLFTLSCLIRYLRGGLRQWSGFSDSVQNRVKTVIDHFHYNNGQKRPKVYKIMIGRYKHNWIENVSYKNPSNKVTRCTVESLTLHSRFEGHVYNTARSL